MSSTMAVILAAWFDSPYWGALGLTAGVVGGVVVAFIQRKPTELQLGQTAYDQLNELTKIYKSDLADYRQQRAESMRVEESLRDHLDAARIEIAALTRELEGARREVRELREQVAATQRNET